MIDDRQGAVDRMIESHFPGITHTPVIQNMNMYEEMQKILQLMLKDLELGEKEV
jgi:hypothetical protein